MPKFERADLRRRIAEGHIVAVAFDTSILDNFCKSGSLNHAKLRGLHDIVGTGIQLLFPDVVVQELTGHLKGELESKVDDLGQAISKYSRIWPQNKETLEALLGSLPPRSDATAIAHSQVNSFISGLKGIELSSGKLTSVEEILGRYFRQEPPFGPGKQKAEFPDAFALAAIDAWGDAHGGVLVLSNDNAWKEYCENVGHLYCTNDLTHALSTFVQNIEIVREFRERFNSEDYPHARDRIMAALQKGLDDGGYEIAIETDGTVLCAPKSAEIKSIQVDEQRIELVSAEEAGYIFAIKVPTTIALKMELIFLSSNSGDEPPEAVAWTDHYDEINHTFEVIVTLGSEVRDGKRKFNIEVSPDYRLSYVHLGYVPIEELLGIGSDS